MNNTENTDKSMSWSRTRADQTQRDHLGVVSRGPIRFIVWNLAIFWRMAENSQSTKKGVGDLRSSQIGYLKWAMLPMFLKPPADTSWLWWILWFCFKPPSWSHPFARNMAGGGWPGDCPTLLILRWPSKCGDPWRSWRRRAKQRSTRIHGVQMTWIWHQVI